MKRWIGLVLACLLMLAGCGTPGSGTPQTGQMLEYPMEHSAYPEREYRAVWVSYLEWMRFDFSSEEAFRQQCQELAQRCKALGLNTVLAQVRPFGDALYPSQWFPWSHLCTGTQGQNPGFDPLLVLEQEVHGAGLELEAWVNPYRVKGPTGVPELSEQSLASQYPHLVKETEQGIYLNPASQEARDLIVKGVEELLEHYQLEGIHFDDYFYPTTDPEFDKEEYAQQGGGLSLEEWRKQNVNQLVQQVYTAIKARWPEVRFGISPTGNIENNYDIQYSDVKLWLSEPGYVDYLMPQIYWGFGYTTSNGDTQYGFQQLVQRWAELPRSEQVQLYVGLGAYRIGEGDGGSNVDSVSQWQKGNQLAAQVEHLRTSRMQGYGLYRYDSLFFNTVWSELCGLEQENLATCNQVSGE